MTTSLYATYPQRLYLPSDSTQDSFTLTAGRKAVNVESGRLYVGTTPAHRIVPLAGARGVAIQFVGTDANNEVITAVKVWGATFAGFEGATDPNQPWESTRVCDLNLIGTTGEITLSAATVPATDIIASTHLIADTIASWTPGGLYAVIEPAYALGTSDEYSPGSDVPATLLIPNLGPLIHGFVLEFDRGTAASSNALYTLTA
jgi:hypothetical protein